MRSILLALAAAALTAVASPVLAQDAAAPTAAPASDFTITGGATLTSDYRFRGISQSNKRFAIQGTIGVSHVSGFYVGTWGSSIDDYVANGGDAEVDLYGGYKKTFNGTTADVGVLYYYYPGSSNNAQAPGHYNSDFVEPYASLTHVFGPLTGKVGVAYAPKQHALSCAYDLRCGGRAREDNIYLYGEGSVAIPNTPITISAHVGHNDGRSYLTNGLKDYWDWNLGAAYVWRNLTFGVSYVDTDIKDSEFQSGGLLVANSRAVAKAGVVGSIAVAF